MSPKLQMSRQEWLLLILCHNDTLVNVYVALQVFTRIASTS